MIGTNRYIGSPVERIEDLRFLRGRGEFVGDLQREGMLHAAILRSPVAHGLVAAVDASAVLAIAGVRAVITSKDIGAVPRIPRSPRSLRRPMRSPSLPGRRTTVGGSSYFPEPAGF